MNNDLNKALAAILTTALETEPDFFPESYAYLAIGSDMEKWTLIKSILINGNLATMDGNHIRLTDAGRNMAHKCNEFLKVA